MDARPPWLLSWQHKALASLFEDTISSEFCGQDRTTQKHQPGCTGADADDRDRGAGEAYECIHVLDDDSEAGED